MYETHRAGCGNMVLFQGVLCQEILVIIPGINILKKIAIKTRVVQHDWFMINFYRAYMLEIPFLVNREYASFLNPTKQNL